MKKLRVAVVFVCLFAWNPGQVRAESVLEAEFAAMKVEFKRMQEKMAAMEKKLSMQEEKLAAESAAKQDSENRIKELEQQVAATPLPGAPASALPADSRTPAVPARATPASELGILPKTPAKPSTAPWIPEIGVIADTLFTLNSARTDGDGEDRLNIRELELVLGSNVDPFSRLDATVAFTTSEEEAVSLEEAYLTRFGLPWETTARIGKFKPKVGKAIGVHRDSLDTVDEPLVIQRYFGPEGMSKTGVDLSKMLELPIPVVQQVTVGVLEGGNAEDVGVFGDTKRRPTFYSRLKNYIDITDTTGFELGGSYMLGSRDADVSNEVQVVAADATLTHHFNANQNMKLQGEVFNVNRKQSVIDIDDSLGGTVPYQLDGNILGAYGLADFRVHPLWAVGGRYDIVQPIPVDVPIDGSGKYDQAYSGYVTFHQSEFARWRVQVTHTDAATGKDDNAVYLQGTFAIGTHKHKLQ